MTKVPVESTPTDEEFDVVYAEAVQEAAQPHIGLAMKTLVELASGKDADDPEKVVETTPSTRRGSANDIINHGFSRSIGKAGDLARAASGGISITIINQSGEPVEVVAEHAPIDVTPKKESDDGD